MSDLPEIRVDDEEFAENFKPYNVLDGSDDDDDFVSAYQVRFVFAIWDILENRNFVKNIGRRVVVIRL